jgi:IS5 family transposase
MFMEERVYALVCRLIDDLPEPSTRVVYPLRLILRMVLWSIINDRPLCWSCLPENWPHRFRPETLPNQSTLSRRVNRLDTMTAMGDLHERALKSLGSYSRYAAIDGRPLPVGGSSQDRDARGGRAVGSMWRGYKLYAAADLRQAILAFEIHPMNHAEQTVARSLLQRLPETVDRVVGDTIYDSMRLHDAASACGRKVYSPLRENRVGKRQQPRRLQLWRLWQRRVGQRLLRTRDTIERAFARLSGIGFGFKGLPPWIRGLTRVRLWMSGKILLYNLYLVIRAREPTAA